MKRAVALPLICGTLISFLACNRVQWSVTRQLCGRIQIVDHQSQTILKDTEIVLYRSKSERIPCCLLAETVATIRTDAEGNFNFGKLAAGSYFVGLRKSPQIVFPVYLETRYEGGTCQLSPLFSFDRNSGKAELTETIVVPRN